MTVVFLVVGGLVSGLWLQASWQKQGLIEERANNSGSASVPALVQTAQGANLDASQVAGANDAAFSSLRSVPVLVVLTDSTGSFADAAGVVAYSSGAVKDLSLHL